jgi:hypothetical protein
MPRPTTADQPEKTPAPRHSHDPAGAPLTTTRYSAGPRETTENRHFQLLGRAGLAAYGLVHFTIAYLAARVALGAGGATADKAGALATLAAQPGGRALLWTVTVGLAMLVLWQLGEATVGLRWVRPRNKRTRKRVESTAEAVVFGVLAVSAGKLAAGAGAGSSGKQEAFTARMLALPAGQMLVAAVGVALIAVAALLAYRGMRKTFTEDLDLSAASPTGRKPCCPARAGRLPRARRRVRHHRSVDRVHGGDLPPGQGGRA